MVNPRTSNSGQERIKRNPKKKKKIPRVGNDHAARFDHVVRKKKTRRGKKKKKIRKKNRKGTESARGR